MKTIEAPKEHRREEDYILDAQIGFVLRQAHQRHATIFASRMIEDLTPTQWAALAKLKEIGPSSQNLLGRLTAMDAATIKGVIDRLTKRGFTRTKPDPVCSSRSPSGAPRSMTARGRSPRASPSKHWDL
jgi:hypothetical protein